MAATQLRDFWYVIARGEDLGAKPLARKINGRALVVFRDAQGDARVLDAVCPHRGANLAHGRVVGGTLECPYHGWRFDGTGRCAHIPSNRGAPVPAGHATEGFAVVEQQGLIWTCLGSPVAPPPRFDVLDDRSLHAFCYELVAPVPFDWWVENALDFAHLPFVHPFTIGDQDSALDDFAIERRADDLGFVARAETRGHHSLFARMLKLDMRVTVTLAMPGSTLFDIDLGKGRRQGILALATPEDGRSTRVWNFAFRNFLRVPFGDTVGKLFIRRLLHEDIQIAARSLELVSLDRPRMLSTRADQLSLEFLRLLRLWRARELSQHAEHGEIMHPHEAAALAHDDRAR
jgi:phenylpropionate dioxygenase-like ring-hydroxylating dioxygenase large terminal subunit